MKVEGEKISSSKHLLSMKENEMSEKTVSQLKERLSKEEENLQKWKDKLEKQEKNESTAAY
jgi:hypothetical protein